jgi:hypothetical protein
LNLPSFLQGEGPRVRRLCDSLQKCSLEIKNNIYLNWKGIFIELKKFKRETNALKIMQIFGSSVQFFFRFALKKSSLHTIKWLFCFGLKYYHSSDIYRHLWPQDRFFIIKYWILYILRIQIRCVRIKSIRYENDA